jgi:hypothetical protein
MLTSSRQTFQPCFRIARSIAVADVLSALLYERKTVLGKVSTPLDTLTGRRIVIVPDQNVVNQCVVGENAFMETLALVEREVGRPDHLGDRAEHRAQGHLHLVEPITDQRQKLLDEKRRLDEEAAWVEQSFKKERQAANDVRLASYLEYFGLLDEEKTVLRELYEPPRSALADQGSQEQKLELVCRVTVKLNAWIERGAELFDQRKAGAFRYDQIERIARGRLWKAWRACDTRRFGRAFRSVSTTFARLRR